MKFSCFDSIPYSIFVLPQVFLYVSNFESEVFNYEPHGRRTAIKPMREFIGKIVKG